MNSIIKWLTQNNFIFKSVIMNNGNKGIMVNTEYNGYYPSKETWQQQQNIFAKVKRYKTLKAESRGYYTAVLITEVI